MTKSEKIIETADKILKMNKLQYSVEESSILIQSQYYNAEKLFNYGANISENNIDLQIEISENIISICKSFHHNLKLMPENISWEDQKMQIDNIDQMINEVEKSLKVLNLTKKFQDEPTPFNAMQLQNLINSQK